MKRSTIYLILFLISLVAIFTVAVIGGSNGTKIPVWAVITNILAAGIIMSIFGRFYIKAKKKELSGGYETPEWKTVEQNLYKEVISGIIDAKSGADLKVLLDRIKDFKWQNKGRFLYILGLMQGALMQFNKEESARELRKIFMDV